MTVQLAESESAFRSEIAASNRLSELLEQREQETLHRLTTVEQEWEDAKQHMAVTTSQHEADLARERARGDSLEHRIREMRDVADSLADGPISRLPQRSIIDANGDVFERTASPALSVDHTSNGDVSTLAMRLHRSGKLSYTELYSRFVQMQSELDVERAESQRLGECLNHILAEISDRAPMMREQRQEWERTLQENNELNIDLSRTLAEKEDLARINSDLTKAADQSQRDVSLQSRQLADLGQQIRGLLRRLAVLEDPTIESRDDAHSNQGIDSEPDLETADTFISMQLVTFSSIDQMQRNNATLLRLVRDLSMRMESEETTLQKTLVDSESAAVQEAHDLIVELRSENAALRSQNLAATSERDSVRDTLRARQNAGTDAHASAIRTGAAMPNGTGHSRSTYDIDIETVKREMSDDAAALRSDLVEVRAQWTEASTNLARSEAQRELVQERLRRSQDSERDALQDAEQSRSRYMQAQADLRKHSDAVKRLTDDLSRTGAELRQKSHEVAMLSAEKQLWKVSHVGRCSSSY